MSIKFKKILRDFKTWVIEGWIGGFWHNCYYFLIPLGLLWFSIAIGFTVFYTDGVNGWHISFENSLLFTFGIFFTLFLYRMESNRDLAVLNLRMKENKGKLKFVIENKSGKNYLKNITMYVFTSDTGVVLEDSKFYDMTEANSDGGFLVEHKGEGKCWAHFPTLSVVPSKDTYIVGVNFSNTNAKEINFRLQVKAENAESKVQDFVVQLDNNKKITNWFTAEEYKEKINSED